MEKYTKPQMEVIEFENEDVITGSIGICAPVEYPCFIVGCGDTCHEVTPD